MKKRGRPSKSNIESEFVEEVQSMGVEALKEKIVSISKYVKEMEKAKKEDPDLQRILEEKKTAEVPYTEAFKAAKAKINYVLELLESKGQ